MFLNRIVFNCYDRLNLPDEYFMHLLIIILGDVIGFRKFNSKNIDLTFKKMQIKISTIPDWNHIVYGKGEFLDLRITEKEYQSVIKYVRNKNFL